MQWERPKINLAELAKKRWIEGWPIEKLAKEFDYKQTTIRVALRRLRNGEIDSINLGPQYRKAIMEAVKIERKKFMRYLGPK